MKLTHTRRPEKVYSKLLNREFYFNEITSNTLVSKDSKSILYTYITNNKHTKTLLINDSTVLDTHPFILIKNTLAVLDFVPDFEYWLSILSMNARGLYPNINKIHVILGIDNTPKTQFTINELTRAIDTMIVEGYRIPRISFTCGITPVIPHNYKKYININGFIIGSEIKYGTSNSKYKNTITIIPAIGDKNGHLSIDNKYCFAIKYEKSVAKKGEENK